MKLHIHFLTCLLSGALLTASTLAQAAAQAALPPQVANENIACSPVTIQYSIPNPWNVTGTITRQCGDQYQFSSSDGNSGDMTVSFTGNGIFIYSTHQNNGDLCSFYGIVTHADFYRGNWYCRSGSVGEVTFNVTHL
jgi:hypothetical protein